MDLQALREKVSTRLSTSALTTQHLLGRCRLIDEESRETSAFSDPHYLPFYYHLGANLPGTKNLMEIGFRLGLPSSCFLQGCPGVENYFGFHEESHGPYYSSRLARGNVLDHLNGTFDSFYGYIEDGKFLDNLRSQRWDVIIIDEEISYDKHRAYLDLVWSSLADDGLIVVDYLSQHEASRRAFREFCTTKSREPVLFPTRYGTGIIQR